MNQRKKVIEAYVEDRMSRPSWAAQGPSVQAAVEASRPLTRLKSFEAWVTAAEALCQAEWARVQREERVEWGQVMDALRDINLLHPFRDDARVAAIDALVAKHGEALVDKCWQDLIEFRRDQRS